MLLQGTCRYCKKPISWLYPFIEIVTAILLSALYVSVPFLYFPAYFIFFSALIVTIRSDIETMLISRFTTLFLIPLGLLFSSMNLLPITLIDSALGIILGYFFLFVTAQLFLWFTGKEGIGQGDIELLAFIGSFVGIIGCWLALFFASIIGSLFGITYMIFTKTYKQLKIPFGPFLAFGAISFVLFRNYLITILLGLGAL